MWKNGNVGGFRTFMGYDPGAGIGVVAMANAQPDGPDDIGLHILDPAIPVNLRAPFSTRIGVSPDRKTAG